MDASSEIASRVEGRLERLGLSVEEADRQAGLNGDRVRLGAHLGRLPILGAAAGLGVSARETAVAALHARLVASLASRNPAPQALRGQTAPQRLPPGGLVVIRDGEIVQETAILSPMAFAIAHRAEVEVTVAGATPTARSALLDALLVDIGAAITADRTLGGAVEWAQPGSLEFQDVEFEGAAAARAALVPVTLWFTLAGSPLASCNFAGSASNLALRRHRRVAELRRVERAGQGWRSDGHAQDLLGQPRPLSRRAARLGRASVPITQRIFVPARTVPDSVPEIFEVPIRRR